MLPGLTREETHLTYVRLQMIMHSNESVKILDSAIEEIHRKKSANGLRVSN